MATYDFKKSLQLLRQGSGDPNAEFRDSQEAAIEAVVEGSGRLLVVQKTGWGKSFVYFIATQLLRDQGFGPALLISPLLSLMRNQISAAERMGVRAVTINSDNREDWEGIEQDIKNDVIDILLISPERLANEYFRQQVMGAIQDEISILVIDEAHCISDWGHDFRPHYRILERILKDLPPDLRVLATTATANDRVVEDLHQVLGPGLELSRGDLARPSLSLETITLDSQSERLAWLAGKLRSLPGNGIIYALTIRDAGMVAEWLQSQGFNVSAYTGAMSEGRAELEQALLDNELKALVATTALGMGFDKPDLAFVIHYQTPGSVVAYYQQVGRAGRGINNARGILLSGKEEIDITNYFIENAFPTREEVGLVIGELAKNLDGLSTNQLMSAVNLSMGRIQKTLELLSLESPSPIARDRNRWQLTSQVLAESFWERAERLTGLRKEEQLQMQEYVALKTGHMEFLIQALDGDTQGVPAKQLEPLGSDTDPYLLAEALAFLKRSNITIEPRKQWPFGGMPVYGLKGRIPLNHQAMEGKSLCIWGDDGWGKLVREGRYQEGRYSDVLVQACTDLFTMWDPSPTPSWITCVPSTGQPGVIEDFSSRLAAALSIPFVGVIDSNIQAKGRGPMSNSVQRASHIDGTLFVNSSPVPASAVLLIDDLTDTRWTLTTAAWLLQSKGSGPVFPLVLSMTGWR